jgi:hypothetical protein
MRRKVRRHSYAEMKDRYQIPIRHFCEAMILRRESQKIFVETLREYTQTKLVPSFENSFLSCSKLLKIDSETQHF